MKVTMPKKDYVCPFYEKMIKKFETYFLDTTKIFSRSRQLVLTL